MFTVIKVLALTLFLLLAHRHIPALIADDQISGGQPVFTLVWLFAGAGLFALGFYPRLWLRLLFALLFVTAAGNALAYLLITGSVLNAIEVERLFQDIGHIDDTFAFYGPLVWQAIGIATLLLPGLLLPVRKRPGRSTSERHGRWLLLAVLISNLLPVLLIGRAVYRDGGGDSDSFPVHVAPLAFAGVLVLDNLAQPDESERARVALQAGDSPFDKIVVLMDESVRGDWLDINSAGGVNTGLTPYSDRYANFGLAASFANCSAASNLSLRYFVRRDSFRRDAWLRPSMWAWAKQAGYRSIYLDGQRRRRELQNFMTATELNEIDEFIQHDGDPDAADKDMILAGTLRELLARPEKLFIYVNKNGVHFPYEGKYPAGFRPFQPFMDSTQIDSNEGNQYGSGFGNEAFRNSYRNAVAWNTGEFFQRLLPDLDLSRTLLVYTADHGQNFTKTREVGFLTHCTVGPAPAAEGTVPLLLLTGQPDWQGRLRLAAGSQLNRASHWRLPATLAEAMGYAPAALADEFEPSLFSDDPRPPQFVSTYFVRFGLQPVWNDPLPPATSKD